MIEQRLAGTLYNLVDVLEAVHTSVPRIGNVDCTVGIRIKITKHANPGTLLLAVRFTLQNCVVVSIHCQNQIMLREVTLRDCSRSMVHRNSVTCRGLAHTAIGTLSQVI